MYPAEFAPPAVGFAGFDILTDRRGRDAFAWVAFAALAVLVGAPCALPFARLPIASFQAEWVAGCAGLVAMTAIALARPGSLARLPRAALLPLGFAGLWAAHAATGLAADARLALLACLVVLWAAGVVWAAAAVRDALGAPRVATGLALALVAGALANCAAGLVQKVGIPPSLHGWVMPPLDARVYGNLGQANHLADQLCLALAATGWLAARSRVPAVAVAIVALVLGGVLSLTGSRMGLVALLALSVAGAIAATRAGREARARLWLVVGAALAAWIAVELARVSGGSGAAAGAVASATTRLGDHAPWVEERTAIWRGAWTIFAAHPWFGVGQGGFAHAFFEVVGTLPPPRPTLITAQAHNLSLHIAAESGVVGLAVLAAGALAVGLDLRRGARGAVGAWAVASVGVVLLHSVVEYPLWYAYFLGPVAVWLGLAGGAPIALHGSARLRGCVAAAMFAGGAFALVTLEVDWRFLRDFAGGRRAEYLAKGDAWVRDRMLGLARQSLLAHLAQLGFVRAMRLDASRLAEKRTVSANVLRTTPAPDVVYRHALLLAASGDEAGATRLWRDARAAYPAVEADWVRIARTAAADGGLPAAARFVSNIEQERAAQ